MFHFVAVVAMNHGKQVVAPVGQMPWSTIAMADKTQGADLGTEFSDKIIIDIPDAHAIGGIAQAVVIGHGGNAANAAVSQHPLQAKDHLVSADAQLFAQLLIGLANQRQAFLGK
jgi:hypothetical protein